MKRFDEIMRFIAHEQNTTPENVYNEMQLAIDAAFDDPDPKVQTAWKESITFKGDRPTPEEVIESLTQKLRDSVRYDKR